MKTFYNISSLVLVLLYIVGVLFGAYTLTYDSIRLQRVGVAFPELLYMIIVLSVLGLLGFLFLFLRKESSIEIVYSLSQNNQQIADNTAKENELGIEGGHTGVARMLFSKIKLEHASEPILEASLKAVCQHLEAGIGAMYLRKGEAFEMETAYALYRAEDDIIQYQKGEGLVGQVGKDGKPIKLSKIPDGYMEVVSGLGSAQPSYLVIYPIKNLQKEVVGVIELATFKNVGAQEMAFLEEMALLLAKEIV